MTGHRKPAATVISWLSLPPPAAVYVSLWRTNTHTQVERQTMCQQTELNLLRLFIPFRDRLIVLFSSLQPLQYKAEMLKIEQKALVCHVSHFEKRWGRREEVL